MGILAASGHTQPERIPHLLAKRHRKKDSGSQTASIIAPVAAYDVTCETHMSGSRILGQGCVNGLQEARRVPSKHKGPEYAAICKSGIPIILSGASCASVAYMTQTPLSCWHMTWPALSWLHAAQDRDQPCAVRIVTAVGQRLARLRLRIFCASLKHQSIPAAEIIK